MYACSAWPDRVFSKSSVAMQGFVKSWGMILASEIGDKTFFIAALMAMKHPRRTVLPKALRSAERWNCRPDRFGPCKTVRFAQVFAGAIGALAAMTILSAVLGWAAPNLVRILSGSKHDSYACGCIATCDNCILQL